MYRTSEYVSLGHPDKIADYISEYILDRFLEKDKNTRYALEVQIKNNKVSLAGEITSSYQPTKEEIKNFVEKAIEEIGYTSEYQKLFGKKNILSSDKIKVTQEISLQSNDIKIGVDNDGWGDQGIFTGYAELNENSNYMPLDHYLASRLGKEIYKEALKSKLWGLDIKTQISILDNKYKVIVACPLYKKSYQKQLKNFIKETCLKLGMEKISLVINGTGTYKKHGPVGDCGTTGRKLAVDFYGNNAPIGGGCPWTKDPSKADLTLNLYSRMKAKRGLLEYFKENKNAFYSIYQTSCCIGQKELIGTLKIYDKEGNIIFSKDEIEEIGQNSLIDKFDLKNPIFSKLCKEGLFSNKEYKWENF